GCGAVTGARVRYLKKGVTPVKNALCCLLSMILTATPIWLPAYGQAAPARHPLTQRLQPASLALTAPHAATAYFSDPCAPKNPPPGYVCKLPQGSSPSSLFKISFATTVMVIPRPILRITSPKGTTIFEMKLNCKTCGKPGQSLLLSLNEKE